VSTDDTTERETRTRGPVARLRASPFVSELLSNRLALTGLAIILGVVVLASRSSPG